MPHEGTQQCLVSLGLEVRGIAASVPPDRDDLRRQLTDTVTTLDENVRELQEISRSLHPAALAKGGLDLALIVLARRSVVPVELDTSVGRRLAPLIEVTVYHAVCDALANAAKHSQASVVQVRLTLTDGIVRLWIRDDGVGGAELTRGSGLIGLTDRVEALDGRFTVASPCGGGTTLEVALPLASQGRSLAHPRVTPRGTGR